MRNTQLESLIQNLKTLSIKEKVKIWKRVAEDLEKPRRIRRAIDVSKIPKVVQKGETAVVPGKVLGTEKVDVPIAAYSCSETVRKNNKIISLQDLIKKNPKGSKCRIVG